MALELGGLLTRKIGPLPGWAWALGVGGAVFILGPRLLKGSSSGTATTTAPSASGFEPQSFAQGFSQGAQYQPSGSTQPAAASTQTSAPSPLTDWLTNQPLGIYWVPQGQDFGTWSRNLLNAYQQQHGGNYPGVIDWQYLQQRYRDEQVGASGASHTPLGLPTRLGLGGPRNRSASIGSISSDPHSYFHPSIKTVPGFAHFTRGGVGGAPVEHAAAVHEIAHQAAVHPARLQMINSRPHRFIRVA